MSFILYFLFHAVYMGKTHFQNMYSLDDRTAVLGLLNDYSPIICKIKVLACKIVEKIIHLYITHLYEFTYLMYNKCIEII